MFKRIYLRILRAVNSWTSNQIEGMTDLHPNNNEFNRHFAQGIEFAASEVHHYMTGHPEMTPNDIRAALQWHADYYKDSE